MEHIVLYSTDCPKCKILKRKLDEARIKYIENKSVEMMLSIGIKEAPKLLVDDTLLDFSEAVKWLKERADISCKLI